MTVTFTLITVQAILRALDRLFTLFGVGVVARPPEWVRNPFERGPTSQARTILISGATGFIGGHLVRRLVTRGDAVVVLTRRPDIALDRFGPHVRIVSRLDELAESTRVDAIVNLAGAPILGFPWTRARRAKLVSSRVETTRALVDLMGRLSHPVSTFISGSAVGFYGIHADEIIDEDAGPANLFQSQLCQQWEATARFAASAGARLVLLRTGLVLGRDGGALPQLARPVRLGIGAVLGSGKQWMSWIHIADLIGLIEFALDRPEVEGAVNAVSPAPATHREFQQQLGKTLRRPIWLWAPAGLLRIALGEMAQLLVDGQRVVPARATTLGFTFRYSTLAKALDDLLQRAPGQVGRRNPNQGGA
jgi:uncharacterized protein (TIGR01777 family)